MAIATERGSGRTRVRTWVRRYAPAELLAVAGALLGYLLVDGVTGAPAAAAYGAAVGDNVGYYGIIASRELSARMRAARAGGRSRLWIGTLGAVIVEFGPAEALDGTLVRPACTAAATAALGPALGVLVAKLVADLAFYVPVIIGYEWRRSCGPAVWRIPHPGVIDAVERCNAGRHDRDVAASVPRNRP